MGEPFEEPPCHTSARRGLVEEAVCLPKVLVLCRPHGGRHHLGDPIGFKADFPISVVDSEFAGPHGDHEMGYLVERTVRIERVDAIL